MKISRLVIPLAAFAMPLLALAQSGINPSVLGQYSSGIIGVVNNMLVPVLMAIAFIVFLWGVYKYFILGAADEKSRTEGRQFSLWGIIGFVIIVSLWGLVNLLMGTLGLQAGVASPPPPTFGTGSYAPSGSTGGYTGGTFGGGTGVSSATNAALLQQYQAMQNTCLSNPTSADCQAAQAQYSASYYGAYPNPNATIDNAQNTTVGAGADCTYSPCSSGLTCNYDSNLGYPVCGGSSTQDTVTSSAYTDCISSNGVWNGTSCDYYDDNSYTDPGDSWY